MLKRAIVDWIADKRVTPEPIRFEGRGRTSGDAAGKP
jgi:hypothetical protein